MTDVRKVPASDTAVGIGEIVTVRTRAELFMLMYEIAREHRDMAKQAAGNNIHKHMKAEIKESMISILFSYTCLEAYINTVGKDKLGSEWQRYENNSTEAKWKGVSRALATKKLGKPHSVFSDKEEPFKSFLELEKIRKDYLVHRKAAFGDVVQTKYGTTEGTINTFNFDKAEWACKIVKDMVTKLNGTIDDRSSAAWLD
jgi:hypothetical protein